MVLWVRVQEDLSSDPPATHMIKTPMLWRREIRSLEGAGQGLATGSVRGHVFRE